MERRVVARLHLHGREPVSGALVVTTLLALRALAHAQGLTVDPGRFWIYLWRDGKIVSPPFKNNKQAADWLAAQQVKA